MTQYFECFIHEEKMNLFFKVFFHFVLNVIFIPFV